MAKQATLQDHDVSAALDLFAGAISPAVGRVYARYTASVAEGMVLQGTLTGPNCAYARTLPATARFVDRGPGGPPLAEALLPEPCFWTPQMPHCYRAELELKVDGQIMGRVQRLFGIRPLGASGHQLRLDGKAWVLRGVAVGPLATSLLAEAHDTDTTLVVRDPGDALCAEASRVGVLLAAEMSNFDRNEFRRLSRWPAVGLVVLPAGAAVDLIGVGHNVLLAESFAAGQVVTPSPWADVAVFSADANCEPPQVSLPVLARRSRGLNENLFARAACDRLQGELAPRGQFAGYIV